MVGKPMAALLVNADAYFEALGAYRRGDIGAIISQFTQATLYAVAAGRALVADLSGIRESLNSRVRARRDSAVWDVADMLIGRHQYRGSTARDRPPGGCWSPHANRQERTAEPGVAEPGDPGCPGRVRRCHSPEQAPSVMGELMYVVKTR